MSKQKKKNTPLYYPLGEGLYELPVGILNYKPRHEIIPQEAGQQKGKRNNLSKKSTSSHKTKKKKTIASKKKQ